jgi:hypothetical protein
VSAKGDLVEQYHPTKGGRGGAMRAKRSKVPSLMLIQGKKLALLYYEAQQLRVCELFDKVVVVLERTMFDVPCKQEEILTDNWLLSLHSTVGPEVKVMYRET